MQTVPLQSVPIQVTKVVLGGQNVQIYLYQKPQGLFVDINSNGIDVVTGIIARDAVPIICREYIDFIGNLLFIDTQGSSDPNYKGLGNRWTLVYLTAAEYALI